MTAYAWQAVWRQKDAAYRLWMLTPVDCVEASNSPGQETAAQAGRRVRYIDAIRKGDELSSVFSAIHESSGAMGAMPVRNASRLHPPIEARADAVALRIEPGWGACWVFANFAGEAEIDGIRFQGDFGVFCRASGSAHWLMAVGPTTFRGADFGFSNEPDYWRGKVARNTATIITSTSLRPEGWPSQSKWRQNYVRVHDGEHETGLSIAATTQGTITVRRFPLPQASTFELPSVRYVSIGELQ